MYEIDNIRLIPFTEEMISEKYISWFNNITTCEHTSHCVYPMTRDRALSYIRSINNPSSDTIVWAIMNCTGYDKRDRIYSHIGNICLASIDLINRTAEVSIIIGEAFKDLGIGTKAIKQILYHGFYKLNLQRIWLGTSSKNIGMQKVAEKVGMKQEGVLKNALFSNGEYVDDLIYGIIKYRFDRLQSKTEE
jgi:RimJ/RimL family protein N-acetyltransferase